MAISPPGPRRPLTLDETLADLEAKRQASLATALPPAGRPPLPLIPELQGRPDPWASVGLPPPIDLPAFTPAEPTPPPPEPPGIIGRSMEALSEAGGRAAAYYAGNPAALSERPPSLREQAEGAFGWLAGGEPAPGEDPGMARRRAVGRGVGDVAAGLADPSQLALMGGIAGAAALSPVIGTVAGIGAMGMMAKSTFDQASNAIALGRQFGFKSPEFLQAATEAGGNTAILGALGYLGYRSMKRKPAPTEPARDATAPPPTPRPGEPVPPGVPPPQPGEPLPPRGAPPGPPPADAPPRPPTIDPTHPNAELWDDAYRWARAQGMDESQAIGVADAVVTETAFPPPSRPIAGAPKVEKQMGPGEGRPENVGAPPRTELEASTEPFVRATLAEFDRAITAAEAAGDVSLAQRLRNERYKVLMAGSKAAGAPTPARTPEAGSVAFPPTPAQGPAGSATATATAPPPPGSTVPGPRPGIEVTPTIPGEPVAPGAVTPAEAAGARAAGQAPEVDALLAAARDQAAGGTGETLPPGVTTVSGRPEGAAAAAGVRPTPALPPVTGVVPAPLPPPVTGAAPPPAPIPSPVAGPLPAPPPPAPQPQEPVVPAAAPVAAPGVSRIRLKQVDGQWVAAHEGPIADQVQAAFGTNEVETPWGAEVDPAEVIAELQKRQPGVEVVVDQAEPVPVRPGSAPPPTRPAKPSARPPTAVALPRPAPAPPAAAPDTRAEPARRLRIGRGAHGQVEVIFPDSTHADLFSAWGRQLRRSRGEGAGRRGADWPGLARRLKVPEAEVGAAAERYRDRVQRNIRALPEGSQYEAPRWDSEDTEAPAPARAAEAPPEAVQGDIGRGAGGQGWIVRTYGRDKKVVSESEPYVNKDEAKAALKALQAQLGRNRFEARKKEISPTEEDWAAMSPADYEARVVSPGGTRDPNRLDLGELKEQAAAGSATTAYRAIRAAHSMGKPVHEGWYDVFPMLRKVPKTGERGRAGAEFKPEPAPTAAPTKKPTKLDAEIAATLEFSRDGYVEPDTDFSGFAIGDVVNVKGKKQTGTIKRLWSVKQAKNAAQEKQIRRNFPSGRVASLRWPDGTSQNLDFARLSKVEAPTAAAGPAPTRDEVVKKALNLTIRPGDRVVLPSGREATVTRWENKPDSVWVAFDGQPEAEERWRIAALSLAPEEVTPPAEPDADVEAELGPGEEPVAPSDVAPADRDWIAEWGPLRSAAFQRASERVAEGLRADLRKLTNDQVFRRRLAKDAKADWEYFGQTIDAQTNQKIKNRAKKRAAAKQKMLSLESLYASGRESMAGLLKDEKEGALVTDRIHALIEGRAGLNRTQRDPGALPLTGYAYEMVRGWAEERGHLTVDEAVAAVLERAPYYAERWTTEDVISDLERLAERLDKLNEQQVRFEVDIPGIGRKRLKSLLDIPPAMLGALSDANTAALKQVTDYRRRTMAERSAIEELLTEFQEPEHHDTLHRIADALTQDLALIAARPELKAEEPLAKTFMWDVRDPATGEQITTEQAINAIREGRGRLFARILSEHRLASALMADNIPFDVPDGGLADGEGTLEAPGSRRPQQDLIPGFLEAVMGTPQKPVEREGKPASNFTDSELFTQEERQKARAEEEKSKKAQRGLFNEASKSRAVIFLASPQDEFNGRYGPPPRRATEAQLAARRKWLDLVTAFTNTGGSYEQGAPALRPAKDAEGGGDLRSDSLQPALGGGTQDAERGRAGGGARGGERGLAGVPGGEGAAGPGRSGAGRTSRKGIFEINDPRYAATHAKPPKYDLIPARLRGVDANGDSYLSEDQQIGVAKAIEAGEKGSGFLFEDGTGVGKTRELLAVASHWAAKPGTKVVIISKAAAIEAAKGPDGVWRPSGSYADDSAAMGIPITYLKDRGKLEAGKIYLGTYHNLRDYQVDSDTVLLLDEAHQLKNTGESEMHSAGTSLIRKAKVTVFATATPGDKPYHMAYLASIGLMEGQEMVDAMKKLGVSVKEKKRFSERLYNKLVSENVPADKARAQATETFHIWKTTNLKKMHKETEALFTRLTENGTVVKREVDMSSIDVRTVMVRLPEDGHKAMAEIESGMFDRKTMLMHQRRQQEPYKLEAVKGILRGEFAEGRQVVIFAARVNRSDVVEKYKDPHTGQMVTNLLMSSEGTLKQLREWLKDEAIPFAEIHGGADEDSKTAQARFQSGEAKVVIATYEKGGTGINLDDRGGAAPRTMVMMTPPFDSVSVVQAVGRIHRFTTRSASRVHMLFTDHGIDKWNARILATKIAMLHAMVSGDIELLDPSMLGGGEEALQAGTVHYGDAAVKLLKEGPPDQANGLRSAREWNYVIAQLKGLGVKITQKGGEFSIQTHEGFAIEGTLEKTPRARTYGVLRWSHDEEAGELVKTLALAPSVVRGAKTSSQVAAALASLHPGREQLKKIITTKQYEFHARVLRDLGAIYGTGGKLGSFTIPTAEGHIYAGELVAAAIDWNNRAKPGQEGGFYWQRLGSDLVQQATQSQARNRREMDRLLSRIERGASFRDLYTRHQPALRELFGNDTDLFMRMLAVTFQATNTRGSFTLALKAYKQLRLGQPFAGFMGPVRRALEKLAAGEPGYVRGPKMRPFAMAATNEDLHAIAVDRHVGRFILGDAWNGSEAQINRIIEVLREAAKILGWTGREMQSAAWAAAQMEGGLRPEEIQLYDDILIEKATEIRRFRAYFGDVAGPRSWTAPAVRTVEDREAAGGLPSDPTAELTVEAADPLLPSLGVQRIEVPGYARPLLNWMKPGRLGQRAGAGLSLQTGGEIAPGVTIALTAIREGFQSIGRVEWNGMWVGDLENAAAVYQVVRNPSLEHGTFFFVLEDGTIGDSIQASSQVPAFIQYGMTDNVIKMLKGHATILEGNGHKVRGIISLHNHPSGNPTPSSADLDFADTMKAALGKLWMGMVVINHEKAAIVDPTFDGKRPDAGGIHAIYRSAEGFQDPDPFLVSSIDSASYYDTASPFKIRNPTEMMAWATKLVAAGLNTDASTVSLMLLDADKQLRMIVQLPEAAYTNPRIFKPLIARIGKLAGVNSIVAMAARGGGDMWSATREYMLQGYVADWLVFGQPATFLGQVARDTGKRIEGYSFPWDLVADEELFRAGRWPVAGDRLQVLTSGWGPAGNPSDHPAWPTQSGSSGGGIGAPPPPPPAPPGGPGGPRDDDPDWWARRVRYARMRVRARLSEAAAFIDPRAFWDAFVLGVDAVLRGFRSFGRWLAELARAIPGIGQWGRRLWNYLRSIGAPVETEIQRPRGPRPFEEAAGRAEGAAGRGPIRPIPRPTNADLLAAAEGLLRGELGERADAGAGRPLGVDRPGDLAINIGQIRDEAGIRDAMVRIIRFLEGRFGQARLKKTEPEMRAEALELGYTEGEYLRMLREKGALTSGEIIAGRVLRQGAGVDFLNKWTTWREATAALERIVAENGPPVDEAAARALALDTNREMLAGLQKFIGMMYGTAAAGAEAGRALRAHGMMVQAMTPLERSVQRLMRGAQPNERQLAALVDALHRQDAGEIGRITRQLHRPGLWKTLSEYYINSILSGPATPAANVMGNLVHEALLRTPERGVAAFIEKLGLRQAVERALTGNDPMPTERVAGEAMAALRAQVKFKFGVLDALKLAWEAVGNEEVRFMTGVKGEYYPPAIPGVLGKIVRTPGRVMEALDIGAKYSAMAAERAARVWRKVYFEATERGGFTPEQRNARMDAVNRDLDRWILLEDTRLRDPQLFQDTYGREGYSFLARNRDLGAIYKEMVKAADVSTFRDDTTKFTNYVKAMRGSYPWLTFVVPFIHTPERILVQAIRRTPVGLAKSLWNIRTGKLSGGTASDRLAQGAMGTMVTAAIYMLAKDGYITGGGPADPRERQNWLKTGKLPYAIKVGKKWVSMARIEPIATQLGFAADLAEAQDQKIAGDVWDKLHYSVINNIANKTYLQGIVSAAEAVGDPDRYGARLWKQMVGAAVPNLLASAARAIDPTIRQSDSVAETLMGRVPLLSESVPARLTGTGEPVQRGELGISRFMSPFRYSTEAGPEANLERLFLETGYNPQAPPKTMTLPGTMGRKVELTRAEREIYARYAARATAFARALTTENDWSGLDVYAKEEILKRIYRFTHDAARRDILASIVWRAQQGRAQVVAR